MLQNNYMSSKSSDRRLAAGPKAASFLHGAQKSGLKSTGQSTGGKHAETSRFEKPELARDRKNGAFLQGKVAPGVLNLNTAPKFAHSAFSRENSKKTHQSRAAPLPANRAPSKVSKATNRTVHRTAHGKSWEDETLTEWDPNHFRLFVGNLGSDATDLLLTDAFNKYPSFVKARVPRDKRTDKNKGYGFVAFAVADDYLRAFKEMNGKHVGHHPVQLKRAETSVKTSKAKRR